VRARGVGGREGVGPCRRVSTSAPCLHGRTGSERTRGRERASELGGQGSGREPGLYGHVSASAPHLCGCNLCPRGCARVHADAARPCEREGRRERTSEEGRGAGGSWFARMHFLPSTRTVKTRPREKCVCGVSADARGCPDGKFYHRTSVLTSLLGGSRYRDLLPNSHLQAFNSRVHK
jgi:hypothetical protein